MRVLGIGSAAVIGLFAGMLAGGLIAAGLGGGEGAQEVGTLLGALSGGIGLAVWVGRLVPRSPSRLRDRGVERMRRR